MISEARAYELLQEALNSLQESGMMENPVVVSPASVLLGSGSPLDSLGFVTFITELEDRLARELGRDVFFVLDDIQDFNITSPFLAASTFANYLIKLSQ